MKLLFDVMVFLLREFLVGVGMSYSNEYRNHI